jgi:hypothetical protein
MFLLDQRDGQVAVLRPEAFENVAAGAPRFVGEGGEAGGGEIHADGRREADILAAAPAEIIPNAAIPTDDAVDVREINPCHGHLLAARYPTG